MRCLLEACFGFEKNSRGGGVASPLRDVHGLWLVCGIGKENDTERALLGMVAGYRVTVIAHSQAEPRSEKSTDVHRIDRTCHPNIPPYRSRKGGNCNGCTNVVVD